MPTIIQDMPWVNDPNGEELRLPDGRPLICPITHGPVRIRQDQPVVWASLAPWKFTSLPPDFPVFPLLIDIGFNDSFLMQRQQAWNWMTPAVCKELPENGQRFPVHDERIINRHAALWLHPNVPGSRDRDPDAIPVRLRLDFGATLAPPGRYARPLPLLGMRAIWFNGLTLCIDGWLLRMWLDTR
jgi:hypothetical protein